MSQIDNNGDAGKPSNVYLLVSFYVHSYSKDDDSSSVVMGSCVSLFVALLATLL